MGLHHISVWIVDFLPNWHQTVRLGTSSTLPICTGAPQGCILSPLLYTLKTDDSSASHTPLQLLHLEMIQPWYNSAEREEMQGLLHTTRPQHKKYKRNGQGLQEYQKRTVTVSQQRGYHPLNTSASTFLRTQHGRQAHQQA